VNFKAIIKDKRTWWIAGGLGVGALLLYMRAGGSKTEGDDGADAQDYSLGYYLPGGSGLPATDATNTTDPTASIMSLAEHGQTLQANQVYSGIWANMVSQLTGDLKGTTKQGAAGKFNFGGQAFDFDFTFKAPTAPAAQPANNNKTIHTVVATPGFAYPQRQGGRS
jgi:hypothetical protein